jgi:type I restriction enzyme S subunit
MTDWPFLPLEEVLSLEYGRSLPARDRGKGGKYDVAGSNGPDGRHTECLVRGPGVVVGRKGSAGKVHWYESDFWPIDTTYYVKPRMPLDMRWAYYVLGSLRLPTLATTTGVPGLNRNDVYRLELRVPPLNEQHRIAEILDQASSLRRMAASMDRKAKVIIPALFLQTFGDPVANPMSWPKLPIGQLATVTTGNTPPRDRSEYYGGQVEWIKSDNINTPSHYLTPASERLSYRGSEVGRLAVSGSTLVTCIAGSPNVIGNAALANRLVAFNQQINAATPKPGVDPYFLYAHFLVGKKLIQAVSSGGMKGLVSKSAFSSVQFLGPPTELQRQFGRRCRRLCEQTEQCLLRTGLLDNLLAVLTQKALVGDLTASWRLSNVGGPK